MSLGVKDMRPPLKLAAIDAHANTPAAIARRMSQNIITLDRDWSALEVTLKLFHMVLHKSIPPHKILEALFKMESCEAYIMEALQFTSDVYNASKPIYHLAVIAAIACVELLLKVFACKKQLKEKLSYPSEYMTFIQNLDWISRESCSRGMRDMQIYMRMVMLYIISLYGIYSPIMKC